MTSPNSKPRRNPWPVAIVVYFIIFTTAMVSWIVYASRQRMDLVAGDYYEKEVLFQRQIDATRRGRQASDVKVSYDSVEQAVTIRLPAEHAGAAAAGTIVFYRPDNASLDRNVAMRLGPDGTQRVDTRALAPGLWKVRLSWNVRGEDYYFAESLVVGAKS